MSKIKVTKKPSSKRAEKQKEWPTLVYLWAFGLAGFGYLIGETVFRTTQPHPIHWFLALIGGISGIGIGWLWYRWCGDVF